MWMLLVCRTPPRSDLLVPPARSLQLAERHFPVAEGLQECEREFDGVEGRFRKVGYGLFDLDGVHPLTL